MSSERQETLRRLRPQEAHELIRHREMPMEQTIPWEAFEAARGNQVWGRYVYEDGGVVVAYVMFLVYEIVGRRFLWAKHGPVWFKEQSPEREAHLRELLQAEVRRRDKSVVFLRLAAAFSAPDLHPLLNSITYDHTYIADLSPRDPEAIAAAMPKDGRRGVRRAQRVAAAAGATFADESDLSRHEFEKVYQVLVETAERDGFTPHPSEVYWQMLTFLGPKHARLFVMRDAQGKPQAWNLITIYQRHTWAYYGASSNESRAYRGAEALDWWCMRTLADEGCVSYDLMGAGSVRVPELYSVGQYKKRYAQRVTEVDGSWDMPLRSSAFLALRSAKEAKGHLRSLATRARSSS